MGGGTSDSDPLLQTGVTLICDDGTETSRVWYEDYTPDGGSGAEVVDYTKPDDSYWTVSTGDVIDASVAPNVNGDETDVSLLVYQPGHTSWSWDFHNSISGSDADPAASEECEVEQPSYPDGTRYELADFGSVNFVQDFILPCNVLANDANHIISSSTSGVYGYNGLAGSSTNILDGSSTTLADTSSEISSGNFNVNWDAGS